MSYEKRLKLFIDRIASGETSAEAALEELKILPYEDIGFARIDHHRGLRQGFPEVIFCPGKSSRQVLEIGMRLKAENDLVIATRANEEQSELICKNCPDADFYPDASMIAWGKFPEPDLSLGKVALVTAGTADLPVAREAELMLAACGIASELIIDVGVAGLHRVLSKLPELRESRVCIVMAGMDGVLASVIAGLIDCPVIACPTSVGYGAAFEGLAALLTMLNSCAAGLTVVNIDNGFGAAVAAFRIMKRSSNNNS